MSWRALTEDDLASVLDAAELAAYRRRATTPRGVDPITTLLENAAHEARDRIRANADNLLAPGATVPAGMVGRVLVLVRHRVLTICKLPVGDDRKAEYEAAEAFFRDVAAGKVAVPRPETETAEQPAPRPRPRYNAAPSRPAF